MQCKIVVQSRLIQKQDNLLTTYKEEFSLKYIKG